MEGGWQRRDRRRCVAWNQWWVVAWIAVLLGAPLAGAPVLAQQNPYVVSWAIPRPRFVNLFWDRNWDADNPTMTEDMIDRFTSALVRSSYFSGLRQYGLKSVSFQGGFKADSSCGNNGTSPHQIALLDANPFDLTVLTFIDCEVTRGFVPAGPDYIYNVFFAPTTTQEQPVGPATLFVSCRDYVSYHFHGNSNVLYAGNSANPGPPPLAGPIFTAIFPAGPCIGGSGNFAGLTENQTHEMVEAITDPGVTMQVLVGGGTGEIADACSQSTSSGQPLVTPFDGGSASGYWSNTAYACEPGFRPPVAAYVFSPNPMAPPGSLTAGETATVTLTAEDGAGNPVPNARVDLSFVAGGAGEGGVAVPSAYWPSGGLTGGPVGLTATPRTFVADANGQIVLTLTVLQQRLTGDSDVLTAQDPSNGALTARDTYTFGAPALPVFAPSPVAASGTLSVGRTAKVTVTAEDSYGNVLPNRAILLSGVTTAQGVSDGTATVNGQRLTSAGSIFYTDGMGAVTVMYTAPDSLPWGGKYTIRATDAVRPRMGASDAYTFAATPPVSGISFSPSPLWFNGGGTTQHIANTSVTASDSNGEPLPGVTVYLSLCSFAGGSAFVGGTRLTSTPQPFTTGAGQSSPPSVTVSYRHPSPLPSAGTDTILAEIGPPPPFGHPSIWAFDTATFEPVPASLGQGQLATTLGSNGCPLTGGPPNGGALPYRRTTPYRDIGSFSWAARSILILTTQGIIRGMAPGVFDPGGAVTRVQLATLLGRLLRLPPPRERVVFRDVPASFWGYRAVEAAASFIPGAGSRLFAPDYAVSRQDVAAAVVGVLAAQHRLAVLDAAQAREVLAEVPDASGISPKLEVLVATAIDHHIMTGFPDGSFQPGGQLTRAQVAVLLERVEQEFPTAGAPPAVAAISPATGPAGGGTALGGRRGPSVRLSDAQTASINRT